MPIARPSWSARRSPAREPERLSAGIPDAISRRRSRDERTRRPGGRAGARGGPRPARRLLPAALAAPADPRHGGFDPPCRLEGAPDRSRERGEALTRGPTSPVPPDLGDRHVGGGLFFPAVDAVGNSFARHQPPQPFQLLRKSFEGEAALRSRGRGGRHDLDGEPMLAGDLLGPERMVRGVEGEYRVVHDAGGGATRRPRPGWVGKPGKQVAPADDVGASSSRESLLS